MSSCQPSSRCQRTLTQTQKAPGWASMRPGSTHLLPSLSPLLVVADQGSAFKGVFEQLFEISILQQVTNAAALWENKPTERNNATIEEQSELARESDEPQTEAENDELTVQGCIAHNRCLNLLAPVHTRECLPIHHVSLVVCRKMTLWKQARLPKDQHWSNCGHCGQSSNCT